LSFSIFGASLVASFRGERKVVWQLKALWLLSFLSTGLWREAHVMFVFEKAHSPWWTVKVSAVYNSGTLGHWKAEGFQRAARCQMKFEVHGWSFCSDSFFAAGFLVRILLLGLPSLPAFCLCFFFSRTSKGLEFIRWKQLLCIAALTGFCPAVGSASCVRRTCLFACHYFEKHHRNPALPVSLVNAGGGWGARVSVCAGPGAAEGRWCSESGLGIWKLIPAHAPSL